MPNTKHFNLPELPTGAVDWPALINESLEKIERGHTVKVTAGESLAIGNCFYSSTDGTAHKSNSTTICNGIMLSTASTGVEGYGQVSGVYTSTGSTWGTGKILYVTSAAALSTARAANAPAIAFTISSSEAILSPTNLSRQAALTAASTLALSTAAWGQNEVDVVSNMITRIGELEVRLQAINILAT